MRKKPKFIKQPKTVADIIESFNALGFIPTVCYNPGEKLGEYQKEFDPRKLVLRES